MSLITDVARIEQAKADLRDILTANEVTVADGAKIDSFPELFTQLLENGTANVQFGYLTADNKFQLVNISSSSPVEEGEPTDITLNIFDTGKPFPEYTPEAVALSCYQCASVDETTKTWTGYLLIEDTAGYYFSDEVTEGLTFSNIVPQVGSVYNDDALLRIEYVYTVEENLEDIAEATETVQEEASVAATYVSEEKTNLTTFSSGLETILGN